MEFFLSLVALGLAFAGGIGAVLILASGYLRQNYAGFFGTALVAGAGMVSLLSFVLGFFVQGILLKSIIAATCIMLLLIGLWRSRGSWPLQPLRFPKLQLLVVALIVVQVCFVTWLALYKSDLGWDGLFVWEAKAHIAFRHNGALPLDLYRGGYPVTVTEYPVLLPMLQVWMYDWMGHINQSLIKLIGPYLYLAAILMLLSSAQRTSKTVLMAIIPLLLLPVVPEFILGYGSVATGYADFPLAVVWLCTVVHLIEFCISGSRVAARLTALSAMFLPFVKNDGLIALCCIALTLVPFLAKNRKWRAGAWMLGPAFAVWLGWRIFLRVCQVKPAYLLPVTWSTLVTHLDRTRTISQFVIQELVTWDRWSILWPTAIAAGAFLLSQRSKLRCSYPLVMNALLPVLLYPCVFFFSAYSSVQVHLSVAFSRLLIHNGLNAVLLVSTAAIVLFEQERTTSPQVPQAVSA